MILNFTSGILFTLTISLMLYKARYFKGSLFQNICYNCLPLSYWTIGFLLLTLYLPNHHALVFLTAFLVVLTSIGYWCFILPRRDVSQDWGENILDMALHILPLVYFLVALSTQHFVLSPKKKYWCLVAGVILAQVVINSWYTHTYGETLYYRKEKDNYHHLIISLFLTGIIIYILCLLTEKSI